MSISEATDQRLTVNGQRLRVSVQGSGEGFPLLLINGIGAPLDLWGEFRRLVGVETIAFDAPGTGGSPAPLRPRSMWELAHLVSSMLDGLGYTTVDVLGISWGGGLAQHIALWRRSRVRRLVLAATGFGAGSVPARPLMALQLLTPARYFSPAHLAAVGPALFGGEVKRRPELLAAQGEMRSRHRPTLRGYVYQLLAAGTWASLPWLRLVDAETLVLLGGDDPIVHVVNGRVLAGIIPNATLRVVPDAGHLFLVDQPALAASIVSAFLRSGREGL